MTTELVKGVYWVGVADWGLKHFHGFELSTHRGSTYNAFLIADGKTAVVDTVWGPFADQFIENIRRVMDPAKIDYIIANHAETDHSGSLPALLRLCPEATVVVSPRGEGSISGHHHEISNMRVVKTGDRISLGESELVFIEAPMLHWPDSMFTYLSGKNILMSSDAFGQHYASAFRFNDQVDQTELYEEAIKYYANILTPFSDRVLKKIDELLALGLPVDMVCPSHGVLWRKDPMQIVRTYQEWARQKPERKAAILFDTMWDGTRRMAESIGHGLAAEGIPYACFHMASSDRNDVIKEIFQSQAILVGSPTLNKGLLPGMMPILEDMKGLRFKNKLGAAFGTYGWSGESLALLEGHLKACDIPIVAEGVRALWQPTAKDLERCERLGREVARAMKEA